MAVAQLNTATLSEAIDAGTEEFAVSSTTNISVGNLLVVRSEALKVVAIPVSGRVKVTRGVSGTYAKAHANGQRFFIGAPDAYKAIKDSMTALVGDPGVYPDYVLPGQRAEDGAGNEYVLVDATATMFSGTTVIISNDGLYTAAPLTGGSQGSVGLLVEPATSAQYAWAQVYGSNSYAQDSAIDSAATSASIAIAATSVSTPDVGLATFSVTSTAADRFRIYGMFITGAATTATTSAASATGVAVPVFLNYPYVTTTRETITTS